MTFRQSAGGLLGPRAGRLPAGEGPLKEGCGPDPDGKAEGLGLERRPRQAKRGPASRLPHSSPPAAGGRLSSHAARVSGAQRPQLCRRKVGARVWRLVPTQGSRPL